MRERFRHRITSQLYHLKWSQPRFFAGSDWMRQLNPINSNWNKFCESCRPLSQHHSPANSSQKKRDSSAISPPANEAKKYRLFRLKKWILSSLRLFHVKTCWKKLKRSSRLKLSSRPADWMNKIPWKAFIKIQKEEINMLKIVFADREVDRFYGNNLSHPSTLPAQANPTVKSYAQVAKKTWSNPSYQHLCCVSKTPQAYYWAILIFNMSTSSLTSRRMAWWWIQSNNREEKSYWTSRMMQTVTKPLA